jgi:hypothetical protein
VFSTLICYPWAFSSSLKQLYPCEGDSPGTAGGGGRVHKVLASAWHFALRGLVKVDGYICQEEAQDEVVNVLA